MANYDIEFRFKRCDQKIEIELWYDGEQKNIHWLSPRETIRFVQRMQPKAIPGFYDWLFDEFPDWYMAEYLDIEHV
jgi:hypothetical protein